MADDRPDANPDPVSEPPPDAPAYEVPRDWPDVLPPAFTVTAKRMPYAVLLGLLVVLLVGAAAWATSASTGLRILLMVVAAVIAFAAVLVLLRLLQAGKPMLVADAAGVMLQLTPRRVAWEQIERVRIMEPATGARIGIDPASVAESVAGAPGAERLVSLLEARARREGSAFVVPLAATGITAAEARERLTELAAGRTPITD